MQCIFFHIESKFLSYGASRRLRGVGGSHQLPQGLDCVVTLEEDGNSWPRGHIRGQALEKRPFAMHSIKAFSVLPAEADHLETQHHKTLGLKARQDSACQVALHRIWLDDRECLFHASPLTLGVLSCRQPPRQYALDCARP